MPDCALRGLHRWLEPELPRRRRIRLNCLVFLDRGRPQLQGDPKLMAADKLLRDKMVE